VRGIAALGAVVLPLRQGLAPSVGTTFGTSPARTAGIDAGEVSPLLPGNPTQDLAELTEAGIEAVLAQHTLGPLGEIQILNEHHSRPVAEIVRQLVMPVLACVLNPLVQASDAALQLAPVDRAHPLVAPPPLQQFQLALVAGKKARPVDESSIRVALNFQVAGAGELDGKVGRQRREPFLFFSR